MSLLQRMVPPSDVCWFINPMNTIVISAINHSYGSYKPTWLTMRHHLAGKVLFVNGMNQTIAPRTAMQHPPLPSVPLSFSLASILPREPKDLVCIPLYCTACSNFQKDRKVTHHCFSRILLLYLLGGCYILNMNNPSCLSWLEINNV